MPEELAMQVPLLKELLDAMNIYELPGYEADDLLGTLSKKITGYGDECVLVTGDRVSLQLVGGGTVLKYVSTRAGHTESKLYDALTINLDYGIEPEQFIDVKALMGDASDNIPGVRGIGEKTAFDLIIRFSTLDGVYQNIDSPDIKPAVREKLIAGKESAYMSRSLATIDRDAPISCTRECFSFSAFDNDRLYALLDKLEMRSIIARLGLKPPQKTEVISVSERKASVKEEISDFEKAKSAVSGLRGIGFRHRRGLSFASPSGKHALFTRSPTRTQKPFCRCCFHPMCG